MGQAASAIRNYNKAIELDPDNASAYYNRGNAKADLGQHDDTITDVNTAIRFFPGYVKAYHNRGTAKVTLEQYADAIADFDKAIELEPERGCQRLSQSGGCEEEIGRICHN